MKKLLMRWFPKFFHVCQHYEVPFEKLKADSAIHVVIIDDNDVIHRSLGIADERAEELLKACAAVYKTEKTLSLCFEKISKEHCKHANELAWCSMHLGLIKSEAEKQKIISQLFGGGNISGIF